MTRSTCVAMLLFVVAFTATGQSQPDWVIIPGDSIQGGQYGVAVAVHGGDVFVGNSESAGFGVGTGLVAPFRYSDHGWDPKSPLQPTGLIGLGNAVAIGVEFGFAGARQAGLEEAGAVVPYISNSQWIQLAVITPGFPDPGQHFGAAVATDGTTLVVGAPGDSSSGTSAGAVFTLESDGILGWDNDAMLVTSSGSAFDRLGAAVDIDGDWLIAGAPQADAPATGSGRATLFFRSSSGWVEHSSLAPADLEAADAFGTSVAIESGRALVGSPGHGASVGRVCSFELVEDQWIERDVLEPWTLGLSGFGTSLAMDAGRAAVGAPNESGTAPVEGAVYLAELEGGVWIVEQRYSPPPDLSAPLGAMGTSVARYRSVLVAGVPGAASTGGAWIVDLDPKMFLPGDVDGDGSLTVADAITILVTVMGLADAPCLRAADVAGGDLVTIFDAITLLNWLFDSSSLVAVPECEWVDPSGLGHACEESSCP